jgi:hypothetical protein
VECISRIASCRSVEDSEASMWKQHAHLAPQHGYEQEAATNIKCLHYSRILALAALCLGRLLQQAKTQWTTWTRERLAASLQTDAGATASRAGHTRGWSKMRQHHIHTNTHTLAHTRARARATTADSEIQLKVESLSRDSARVARNTATAYRVPKNA